MTDYLLVEALWGLFGGWSGDEKSVLGAKMVKFAPTKKDLTKWFVIPGEVMTFKVSGLSGHSVIVSNEMRGQENSLSRVFFSQGVVKHNSLYIKNQGRGLAKDLYRQTLTLYDEGGVHKIQIIADDVGRYAWAKYGFRPIGRSASLIQDTLQIINALLGTINLDFQPTKLHQVAGLGVSPALFPALATHASSHLRTRKPWKDPKFVDPITGEFLIGKYALMDRSLTDMRTGVLDLHGPEPALLDE